MISDLPDVKEYVNGNFKEATLEKSVSDTFLNLAIMVKDYFELRIIDGNGMERIKIVNKLPEAVHNWVSSHDPVIIKKEDLQDKKDRYYFKNTMVLQNDQIYFSPIDLNMENGKIEIPNTPVLRIATPLFNGKQERKGMMIFNINIAEILAQLPENSIIQTSDNYKLYLKNGTEIFEKSDYNFEDDSGRIWISDSVHIHYKTINYSPDQKLIVGIIDDSKELKYSLLAFIIVFLVIILIFSIVIFYVMKLFYVVFKDYDLSQKALVSSLAALADGRDPETGSHLERTKQYSVLLAREFQKDERYKKIVTSDFIDDIYNAASLHDIGKVGIPDSILLKPGKLTDEEFNEMKRHVVIGSKVLNGVIKRFGLSQSLFQVARNICAFHHEKFNGKGYMQGLSGENIPLEARIFAVCDVYDALRSKRPYKEEMSHETALDIITKDSGQSFDPAVVNALLKCEIDFKNIHNSYKYMFSMFCQIYETNTVGNISYVNLDDKLLIGVEELDNQHKKIFAEIQNMLKAFNTGKWSLEIDNTIKFMGTYVVEHFKTEESYMVKYNYLACEFHKLEHKRLSASFQTIKNNYTNDNTHISDTGELLLQFAQEIIAHILTIDKALGEFLVKKI